MGTWRHVTLSYRWDKWASAELGNFVEYAVGRSASGSLPAVARRPDRHVRVCAGNLELLPDDACRLPLAEPGQAFVVAVQAPDVARVLAGTGQRVVEAKVSAVDGLGVDDPALLQERGAVVSQPCLLGSGSRVRILPGTLASLTGLRDFPYSKDDFHER